MKTENRDMHILEQVRDRYSLFKDAMLIINKRAFTDFISQKCPDFVHKGPKEYPVLVEAVSLGDGETPIIGYVYTAQAQKYIFDKKLS